MAILRAQFTLQHESGLPRDSVTNTFHFQVATIPFTNFANIEDLIRDFFEETSPGATASVRSLLSTRLSGGWELKVYNMADAPPRVPHFTSAGTMVIGAAATDPPLPQEVALKCSYHGTYASGVPKARQRGGFFVGPWSSGSNVLAGSTSLDPRPAATVLSSLRNSLKQLINAAAASADVDLVVYSAGARDNSDQEIEYKDRPLLAPLVTVVTNGWVDNEFDTIRRRGLRATERGIVI